MPFWKGGRRSGRAARRSGRPRLEACERRVLLSTFTVSSTADDGPGSLRQAIIQANADVGQAPSLIQFAIPASGFQTIKLLSPLEAITRPVQLDARSQPGYISSPLIQVDGSSSKSSSSLWNGIVLSGGNSIVAGLAVTGFTGSGILITGPGGDYVESNYIGLTPGATIASPNGVGIQILGSANNTIGGQGSLGNVVSGNSGVGVLASVIQAGDSTGNLITGNRIGTDGAGIVKVPNGQDGVRFSGIGSGQISDNLVSGNAGSGIALLNNSTANLLIGNVVGLTADGRSILGNSSHGVLVDASPSNIIGGSDQDQANQISGNGGCGILARAGSSGLIVQGNQIGTDASSTLALGNLSAGVAVATSDVQIGGTASGGNTIAYNGSGVTGAGVQLIGSVRKVTILSNRIYGNAGLGIDFGNGPTPNHPPGLSAGPNDWINYPTLTTAFTDGVLTTAKGTLLGLPMSGYTIQFFWTSKPDRTGFGQGERLLGEASASTNQSGLATFAIPINQAPDGGFITATATDQAGNTSEFAQTVLLSPTTDLHVDLAATPALAPQGTAVTYIATVTNRGYFTADSVSLAMQLPGKATVVSTSATQGIVVMGSGGQALVSIAALQPGASIVLTVIVQPLASFSGSLTASATATMAETDSHPGDESATATANLTAVVDVSLSLTSGPASAYNGDLLTYVFTASNAGPGTATNIVMTLPFGSGVSYVSAKASQGSGSLNGGRLVVNLGSLGPGASATVTVQLLAAAVGLYSTTATIATDDYDTDASDDSAAVRTTLLGRSDLSLAMQAPTVAPLGQDLYYSIVITNNGPDTATNVVVLDQIPALSALVSAAFDGGATTFANGIVTATLATLGSGASAVLRIIVKPTGAVEAVLTNAARVSGDEQDANPADNVAWRQTTLRAASNLGVTIVPTTPTVLQGTPATFRVHVTNLGPADEPSAVVTIPLPDSTLVNSALASQGGRATVTNRVLTIPLGAIVAGGSADAIVVMTPSADFGGQLVVTAGVAGGNLDLDPSDDQATATFTVQAAADLAVYVTPPAAAYERAPFQYTLTVANRTPSATTGVTLTAPLPPGVEFVSAVASQGAKPTLDASGRLTALLGSLAGSSRATVVVTVRPSAPAGTVLVLSGTPASALPDPTPANDVGRYAVTVAPAVDLMMTLRPLQTSVQVGGQVTWVAQVWNASLTTATGVSLQIPYAAGGAFVGSATTQGTVSASGGVITASVGTLAPRGYATIAFVLQTQSVGPATLTALIAADQHVNSSVSISSADALQVLERPGAFQFAASSFLVPENAGVANLTVQRVGGARGAVSVSYWTTTGTAAPGVNYQPVSGVLTFQPGQTSAVIAVPVLSYAHNRGDLTVGVALGGPTGGATLGATSNASLTIRDLDPDFTPPTVSSIRLEGDAGSIADLAITFSEPLNAATARNGLAYTLYDLGSNGVFGDGDDTPIAYLAPGYDPATNTVYLNPTSPLPAGRQYAVVVKGTGAAPLLDLAGNPLGGGVDSVALFARGTSLKYTDSNGDAVSLTLKKGGFMDLLRKPSGDASLLLVQGTVRGVSTLSGTVTKPRGRGDGVTTIDSIQGLGSFGDVVVSLKSPPFITSGLPIAASKVARASLVNSRYRSLS
ncbi:Calx-beta domain-containing protein [Paludisphaera rhizosphaerae]|uniref:Calx-beta domain-containing protein n=1 Tax=Paludisphaera rhizosphaerae TaxID=2711216 RepID=UPI0013E9BB14|nr:Calx-beta domain-containing protein [Paludisphaera rhizosphaerae]